ncbi:MAG: alkaline phosphatase family protein [Saprospirales bacterium]|nr:alkaline phosphatase family protein [Saprospirales bacterium]
MRSIRSIPFLLFLFIYSTLASGQEQPRLVVGIIIDQMRYDYLYRYWDDLSETGFKRLLRDGCVMHDAHYQYAPTFTGPGHSSIYTGSSPALNGIVGNEWYAREEKARVYCVEDQKANTVGSTSVEGKMSPRRLKATTITDQLELATNRRSKTIGIAIKDRSAILPAGFLNDGAYWFDRTYGHFITSDFYMDSLPGWVVQFNDRHLPDQYLAQTWTPLLPMDRYDESLPDDRPFEQPFPGTAKAVFPYDLRALSGMGSGHMQYGVLPSTPYGNTLTIEFAKAAIEGEQMGMDSIPDLLAVSFSSPDYVGHQFGPQSVEIQDIYLRLDRELGDFLDYLDQTVGLDRIVLFLTADHGAADVAGYLNPPAGYFQAAAFEEGLRKDLVKKFKTDPIEYFINEQVYFTRPLPVDEQKLVTEIKAYATDFPGVYGIMSLKDFSSCPTDPRICEKIQKGVMPSRSGDLYVQLYPGWFGEYYEKGGTTHGTSYAYDTHVPVIFLGWHIASKDDYDRIWIEDIAPTICELLKISVPSGCTGSLIKEVFKK